MIGRELEPLETHRPRDAATDGATRPARPVLKALGLGRKGSLRGRRPRASTRARSSAWPGCSAPAAPSSPGCSSAPTRADTRRAARFAAEGRAVAQPAHAIDRKIAFSSENRKGRGRHRGPHRRATTCCSRCRPRAAGCARSRRRPGQRWSTEYIDGARHPPRRPERADAQPQRRQPAEGAAGPVADHRAGAAHPRRADPRHRHRRQDPDPAAGRRPRRARAWRWCSSPPSSRRCCASATGWS